MSKKQDSSSQENQDTKYPDAKPAQKAEHYEDFTVLAERLRKEGRLDEGNYKKLRSKWIKFLLIMLLICGVPILLSFGHKNGFLIFFLVGLFGVFSIVNKRRDVNRICYLSSFGIYTEGIVIGAIKQDPPYVYYSVFSYIFDREAFFVHKIVYQFYDTKSRLYKITDTYDFSDSLSLKKRKLRKIYNIGDEIKIYYNPDNPNDCTIELLGTSNANDFKLLLTHNK